MCPSVLSTRYTSHAIPRRGAVTRVHRGGTGTDYRRQDVYNRGNIHTGGSRRRDDEARRDATEEAGERGQQGKHGAS